MIDVATPNSSSHEPAWLNAVLKLGVVSAIALWLVYVLTNVVPERLSAMEVKIDAHASEQKATDAVRIQLLRAICANTAKTPGEHAACGIGR